MAKNTKKRSGYGQEVTTIQNAATTLLANIRFADVDDSIKTLVITSSMPGEGKSTVSANLAQTMAAGGKKTLIIDCDSRNRSVALTFGVKPKHGLFAVLSKHVSLADAAYPVEPQGLSILDIEPSIPNPADIFASKRFTSFLEQVRQSYDYAIIDTPPVNAYVDAAIIASRVDACVMVVREGYARREQVTYAAEQLRKADANILGLCMNYCEGHTSYGYGYGYGYGKYYGSSAPTQEQQPVYPDRTRQSIEPSGGKRFKS